MKKYFVVLIMVASLFFSCKKEHSKEYTTISGLIANSQGSKVTINGRGLKKEITINADGTFKDTIKISNTAFYNFFDGKNKTKMFLKNGSDININYTYDDFDKTLSFTGVGSETSTYLIHKKEYDKEENLRRGNKYFKLNESDFNTKMLEIESKFNEMLSSSSIDSSLKANESKKNKKSLDYIKKKYQNQRKFFTVLAEGKVSPKFENYENYNGGTTSLDDFKGKYVYIDVWATWCGPCKREMPSFKKIIEAYKDKNIVFVGISVDDPRRHGSVEKAKAKWKAMVKDKDMAGVQLFADKAWSSTFVRAYGITGIPRFILIDPNGNILRANAPRPSQLALKTLFDSLN